MAQFRFTLWLAYWYFRGKHFDFEWDQGNSTKNKVKHGIEKAEVESVFYLKRAVPLGVQIAPEVKELRLCLVGPAYNEKMISVVFTFRDKKIRPISSRSASKKEKKLYEEIRKATEGL
jgi:uncharacterized DUF497 family protein